MAAAAAVNLNAVVVDVLLEISGILNTGLDVETVHLYGFVNKQ